MCVAQSCGTPAPIKPLSAMVAAHIMLPRTSKSLDVAAASAFGPSSIKVSNRPSAKRSCTLPFTL